MDERSVTRPSIAQWLRRQLVPHELSRRTLLGGIGTFGGLTLLGCSSGSGSISTAAGTATTGASTTGTTASTAATTAATTQS
jgi:hypothetical protein